MNKKKVYISGIQTRHFATRW